jgi:hypothetical protein
LVELRRTLLGPLTRLLRSGAGSGQTLELLTLLLQTLFALPFRVL